MEPVDRTSMPAEFNLHANYPNPFNPSTTISFDLKTASDVELMVYDMRGRLIKSLQSGRMEAGSYRVEWDGRDMNDLPVSSGVYLYRLTAGDKVFSRKMMLLK